MVLTKWATRIFNDNFGSEFTIYEAVRTILVCIEPRRGPIQLNRILPGKIGIDTSVILGIVAPFAIRESGVMTLLVSRSFV